MPQMQTQQSSGRRLEGFQHPPQTSCKPPPVPAAALGRDAQKRQEMLHRKWWACGGGGPDGRRTWRAWGDQHRAKHAWERLSILPMGKTSDDLDGVRSDAGRATTSFVWSTRYFSPRCAGEGDGLGGMKLDAGRISGPSYDCRHEADTTSHHECYMHIFHGTLQMHVCHAVASCCTPLSSKTAIRASRITGLLGAIPRSRDQRIVHLVQLLVQRPCNLL